MHSKKEKIILFHPRTASTSSGYILPLHLLAVSRCIDRSRFDVSIINAEMEPMFLTVLREECKDALCLGIGFMTGYQINQAIEASRIARLVNPHIKIVWGGWHPSIDVEPTLQNEFVDIIVRGQGDRVFAELIEALADGGDISKIKGLAFRENGNVVMTDANKLEDLKRFPPLPFELLPIGQYVRPTRMGQRNLHYYSSQGCPFRCAFCADSRVNERRWMASSSEQFISDITYLKRECNIDSCTLIDSNFFVDMKRIKEIADGLLKAGLNINFGGMNGRASQLKKVTPDEWKYYRNAGFKELFVGAESALQESLDFMRKDAKASDILELADNLRGIDISLTFSFMMGIPKPADLSGNSKMFDRELESAISCTRKIFNVNHGATAWYFIYTPYPGTPLFEQSLACGFKKPSSLKEWAGMDLMQFQIPWLPKSFAKKVIFLTQFVFFFMMEDRLKNVLQSNTSIIRKIAYRIFNISARIRWKTGFFKLRFENILISLSNILLRQSGESD